MDIDPRIRAHEVEQASRVVQMEVANDDGLHILDVVARLCDGSGELIFFGIVHTVEDVVDDGAKDLGPVFTATGFEEDESGRRVRDEDGDHG